MSSMTGERLKVSIFGQSHGEGIGVVIDGLPTGEKIDKEKLQKFLDRRAPGQNKQSTKRREPDRPEFLSGLLDDITCGAPLCAVIKNQDTRSKDYSQMESLLRPSHADFTAHMRYGGHQDIRGGGHFSGRLTAPLCIAGGIAKQILEARGIFIGAHAEAVGRVKDRRFEPVNLTKDELFSPLKREIPVLDENIVDDIKAEIESARMGADSVGGLVECGVIGMPSGIGDPMFGGLENRLSSAIFGIPAVRGIEFGAGFSAAYMQGSDHNDEFIIKDEKIQTKTNNHGGILGGISSGMPIIFRLAIKPTSSIGKPQKTVDIKTFKEAEISIKGRHDPCIALRAVPVVEAVTALVLLDSILISEGI